MQFIDAVKSAFQRYFDFSSRSSRSEFWYFFLFTIIANFFLGLIDSLFFLNVSIINIGFGSGYDQGPLAEIFWLVTFIPHVALYIRRLHDGGYSGWNILWLLLPLIGLFIALFQLCRPGEEGENMYGHDPLGPEGYHPNPARTESDEFR